MRKERRQDLQEDRAASLDCGEAVRVRLLSDADVLEARRRGRELALRVGFPPTEALLVVAAIDELARNILRYALCGEIRLAPVERGARRGLALVARDEGPGITDVELALRDGFSTSNGLGLGLPGAKRLMDEFSILSRRDEGTTIVARKWLPTSRTADATAEWPDRGYVELALESCEAG